MTKQTDTTIVHFILIILMVFDALKTLLSLIDNSVIKQSKTSPIKRSSTQLNKMLKKDLIDLVISYQ